MKFFGGFSNKGFVVFFFYICYFLYRLRDFLAHKIYLFPNPFRQSNPEEPFGEM